MIPHATQGLALWGIPSLQISTSQVQIFSNEGVPGFPTTGAVSSKAACSSTFVCDCTYFTGVEPVTKLCKGWSSKCGAGVRCLDTVAAPCYEIGTMISMRAFTWAGIVSPFRVITRSGSEVLRR